MLLELPDGPNDGIEHVDGDVDGDEDGEDLGEDDDDDDGGGINADGARRGACGPPRPSSVDTRAR